MLAYTRICQLIISHGQGQTLKYTYVSFIQVVQSCIKNLGNIFGNGAFPFIQEVPADDLNCIAKYFNQS